MSISYKVAPLIKGRVDPEDGAFARRIFQSIGSPSTNAILGFACDAGVQRNKGRLGAKEGPTAIREAFYKLSSPEGFVSVNDLGDVVVDGDDLEEGQKALAEKVYEALRSHAKVIVLGGGHETAFGSYLGLRDAFPGRSIGIINLDAHLDLRNIGEAGPSSGTPFNQIRSLDESGFDYLCIGAAREANTQALFNRANDWGVDVVFDTELRHSADAAFKKIDAITCRSDIIYLSVDIDLLPHYQAPGVSAPAVRGVAFSIVEEIIVYINSACLRNKTKIPLVDLVEVSPPHDVGNITAKSAAVLARTIFTL